MGKQRAHRADLRRLPTVVHISVDPVAGESSALGKIIGQNIRVRRRSEGLTQAGLAMRVHASQSEVSKGENGDLRVGDLEQYADALNTNLHELIPAHGSKEVADEGKEPQLKLLEDRLKKLPERKYDKIMRQIDALLTIEEED